MMHSIRNENFERWYFEKWHSYNKKRTAIHRLYHDLLGWANKFARFNLLDGTDKMALDVGCAHSYTVELLANLGYDAYGCDISRLYLRDHAKQVAENLTQCDAQRLSFQTESFNVITCFELLEHLQDQNCFIARCSECLKADGVLILQTPRGIPSVDMILSKVYGRAVSKTSDVEHHINQLVNKSDLVNLLGRYGFASHVETWFLLPLSPFLFNRYFPTRIPTTVPTFRAVAIKKN